MFGVQNSEGKRIPVSARCHRVVRGSRYGQDKQNAIKQGQVLNVYYEHTNPTYNSQHPPKSYSTIKKSAFAFDIDRNLHSINNSIFLYQRYNNQASNLSSRKDSANGTFDRHSPHWLINKRQRQNYEGDKGEIKGSIIQGVMMVDVESVEDIRQVKSPQQQHQPLPLPKTNFITHLLTQS